MNQPDFISREQSEATDELRSAIDELLDSSRSTFSLRASGFMPLSRGFLLEDAMGNRHDRIIGSDLTVTGVNAPSIHTGDGNTVLILQRLDQAACESLKGMGLRAHDGSVDAYLRDPQQPQHIFSFSSFLGGNRSLSITNIEFQLGITSEQTSLINCVIQRALRAGEDDRENIDRARTYVAELGIVDALKPITSGADSGQYGRFLHTVTAQRSVRKTGDTPTIIAYTEHEVRNVTDTPFEPERIAAVTNFITNISAELIAQDGY